MADHAWLPRAKTLVPELRTLKGWAVIGASGAVSSYEMNGVYSLARLSAGLYRLITGTSASAIDVYAKLIGWNAQLFNNGTGVDLKAQLKAYTLSTGIYDIGFYAGTVITDPSSGHEIAFQLDFRDAAEALR